MSEANYQQTEFNSSVACLIRIDDIMKTLHRSALEVIPDLNNKLLYCQTLQRLYKEGKPKFSDEEKEVCEEYKKKLYGTLLLSARDLNIRLTEEVLIDADKFEDYLIGCLDKHNMLISAKNKIDFGDF